MIYGPRPTQQVASSVKDWCMFTVDGTEDSDTLEERHCLKSDVNRDGYYWEHQMKLGSFATQQRELQKRGRWCQWGDFTPNRFSVSSKTHTDNWNNLNTKSHIIYNIYLLINTRLRSFFFLWLLSSTAFIVQTFRGHYLKACKCTAGDED